VKLHARNRTTLAWSLWLATLGCCSAGLVVTLAVTRPLTLGVLADNAFTLVFLLGYATVGLVLSLRRRPTRSAGCSRPSGWSGP
jgi:hypothetical protein